jgi:SnoaL-like domain
MTDDHALVVFDEPPLVGRAANVKAWRGYVERFPDYVIHPHETTADGATVAILGHTTGSHLGLPDDDERELLVLWRAEVVGGAVRSWTLTAPD